MKLLNYNELLQTAHGTIFKCVSPNNTVLSDTIWLKINPPDEWEADWLFGVTEFIPMPNAYVLWQEREDVVKTALTETRNIDDIPDIELERNIYYFKKEDNGQLLLKTFLVMEPCEVNIHPYGYEKTVLLGTSMK